MFARMFLILLHPPLGVEERYNFLPSGVTRRM